MSVLKWSFFIVLLFSSFPRGYGQAQSYRHTVYLEEDGLISSNILDITQAPDGTLWFATISGVSQYDGARWRNFNSVEHQLPRDREQQLTTLPDGRVALAGYRGDTLYVTIWNGEKWQQLPPVPKQPISSPTYTFTSWQQQGETRFAIGNYDTYEYSSKTKEWKLRLKYKNHTQRRTRFVSDLQYDSTGQLYAATYHHLLRLTPESTAPDTVFSTYKHLTGKVNIIRFLIRKNSFYLLGANWMGKLTGKQLELFFQDDRNINTVNYSYVHLVVSQQGEIFFSRYSPAYTFRGQKIEKIAFDHALNLSWCGDIFHDREENIWIATDRGAVKLSPMPFRNYNEKYGLYKNEVSAILETRSGAFMLGGNFNLATFDQEKENFESTFIKPHKTANNRRILRLIEGKDGLIYFAANHKGIGVWDRKSPIRWIQPPNPKAPFLIDVVEYQNNIYCTDGNFIYRIQSDFSLIKLAKTNSRIRKMQVLEDGKMYAMANHIWRFEEDSLVKAFELSSGYLDAIYGMCIWNDRYLVATLQGVAEAKNGKIEPTTIAGQRIENSTYALLVDSKNNLWVGTAAGVFQATDQGELYYYDKNSGLIGNEVNRNALIEDQEGKIWIGTDQGLSIFDYASVHDKHLPPQVQITFIRSNKGNEFSQSGEFRLPDDENTLNFGFVGVSLIDEKSINYRYRLEGQEDTWHYMPYNKQPTAHYSNLLPGGYRFEVQARRQRETWSASVFSAPFVVATPFSESPLFFFMLIAGVGTFGYALRAFFQQRESQKVLREKVEEKTATLRASQEQLRRVNKELDRFVYSVSHDLKSPLNSIKGLVEVVRISQTQEEREQFLGLMEESLSRLRNFIDDLQAYAKGKESKVEASPIDLEKLIAQCIETLKFSQEAQQVQLTYEVRQEAALVSDPNRLQMILSNLLSNSIRYHNPYVDQPFAHLKAQVEEVETVIFVTDNGIGIPDELLPNKVFDMFEKGNSKSKESSGLGLYIVREAVGKLGGEIRVAESKAGEGTTFEVRIPSRRELSGEESKF